jgi:hypothetical protein
MPKCPNCQKEIYYLINVVSGWKQYRFDGENYEEDEFYSDGNVCYFECPECNETLCYSEEEAIEFLEKRED